jgi:hypothetical protein
LASAFAKGYGETGRFGSVTGFSTLLPHRSLAKNKKSSLQIATASLSMLSKIISTIV